MVTSERRGSDITKGNLQKVTLELILRMKRNLAKGKVLQAENRIHTQKHETVKSIARASFLPARMCSKR